MASTQNAGKKRRGAAANGTDPSAASPNGAADDGGVATAETSAARGAELTWDAAELLRMYTAMVDIRLFEEGTSKGFRTGKIGGYLHTYIGQEAVATGFLDAHQDGDKVITAYRDHAHAILLGSDPKAVMAELYGKGTGLVAGKGGSMHLFDAANDMMGGYGIVGGHIPLGVGMAYAQAYQATGKIVQLYLGDGAIHNGAFHEGANLAGLWGRDGMCPCLFLLENNKYGMGTSVERATAMTDLSAKFDSYAIEHEDVDGMDLEAVLECAHRVTKKVRETGRPYAVEVQTYRIAPHGAADFLERYRTKEEVKEWRTRDPIGLLEQRLLDAGVVSEEQVADIKANAKRLADEAIAFAEESPEPSLDELETDVYA